MRLLRLSRLVRPGALLLIVVALWSTLAICNTASAQNNTEAEREAAERTLAALEDWAKEQRATITLTRVAIGLEVTSLAGKLSQAGIGVLNSTYGLTDLGLTMSNIDQTYESLTEEFVTLAELELDLARTEKAIASFNARIASYSEAGYADEQPASARFEVLDEAGGERIYDTYGAIPGGVVFEDNGSAWSEIKSVQYLEGINVFVINGGLIYPSPISQNEIEDIFASIALQDEFGLHWGPDHRIIFGSVPDEGRVARTMVMTDEFLHELTFGKRVWTEHYRPARGYERKKSLGKTGTLAVHFRFISSGFEIRDSVLRSRGLECIIHLVPLTQNSKGIYVPDRARLRSGILPGAYVENTIHLAEAFDYYRRERLVRASLAYSEVAHFARILRNQGIDLNDVLQGPFIR